MTHYLAIDFGGTRTRAGWFDKSLNLLHRSESLSQVTDSQEIVLNRIVQTAKNVVPEGQTPSVIGISAPGPLDAELGIIYHALTLPDWIDVPLVQHISDAFGGISAYMNNDANLAALAEYRFGAGRRCNPMIYLTISTGMGGGMIIDGKLFTGWRNLAIEPGHMRFTQPDGSHSRLEDLCSGTALGNIATQCLQLDKRESTLRHYSQITGKLVGEAALSGDELAVELVQNAGRWLGLGLVNLLHLFNPEAIVIGGSVSNLGNLFFDPAVETIQQNILDDDFFQKDVLRISKLGDDVCLYGAAYYASMKIC